MNCRRGALVVLATAVLAAVAPPVQARRLQQQQQVEYNPVYIVEDVNQCPVPNVLWPSTVFSTDILINAAAPLLSTADPGDPCTIKAQSLASCALDGSLQVQSGCCSTSCATQMTEYIRDCQVALLDFLCNLTATASPDEGGALLTQAQQLVPPLLAAAKRCANSDVPPSYTCPNGSELNLAGLVAALQPSTTPGVAVAAGPAAVPVVVATPAAEEVALPPAGERVVGVAVLPEEAAFVNAMNNVGPGADARA